MDTTETPEKIAVIVLHGVGDADPGWSTPFVVHRLQARCDDLVPEPYARAYALEDRGRTKPGSTFPVHERHATLGPNLSISFLELFWADLSKTGAGPAYYLFATLRLFYEAPFTLAHGFLQQSRTGFHGVIKWLVLTATWLLRWPIAGMNTTAVVTSLTLLALQQAQLMPKLPLAITLCVVLAILAVLGFLVARWRMHRDLWLTDVSFATALFSLIAIIVIGVLNLMLPARLLATPDAYLALCLPPILYIWVVWSAIIAVAIVMLAAVALKRRLGLRSERDVPLARPAAALGLVLLQGLIWKVVVSLPSIQIIEAIGKLDVSLPELKTIIPAFTGDLAHCTKPADEVMALLCRAFERTPATVLADGVDRLKGVFVFNSLLALYTIVLFVLIVIARTLIARLPRASLATKNRWMPRVIMSQLIIAFLFAGSLANLAIYWEQLYESQFFLNNVPGIRSIWLWPTLSGVTIAVLYFFNIFQPVTASIIHIFRDVVDHQYKPRFDSLRFIMPKAIRTKSKWPRRARIQERMNVLVEALVRGKGYDRVVFVAHSQGSVILFEYLMSAYDNEDLAAAKRLDVVTVGSPLTHLYQYYFEEYGRAHPTAAALNPKLASWTNLWRLDDPIGNRVEIIADNFVRNVELGRGGHVDYWRDPAVADAILAAIAPDRTQTIHPTQTAPPHHRSAAPALVS